MSKDKTKDAADQDVKKGTKTAHREKELEKAAEKYAGKAAGKDKDGKRVKQIVDKETGKVLAESHRDKDGKLVKIENGVTVTVYDEVEKEIKKDLPTRSHARRQMLKVLNPVVEVPADAAGKKKNTKEVDLVAKLFDEYAPKYATRKGGYTRIVKIGQRKGCLLYTSDAADE